VTFQTIDDLDHEGLALLVKEHLLAGHLIDRAGMPVVAAHGVDVMAAIAIDEWMGASPIYTKRTQRLLGFEGDTVEACFKAMQLEIGAPLEFMDFRLEVLDDHNGLFHLDQCGALMDVEPMGDEFVHAMCVEIEDPTFDATAWATNPKMRFRPIHRPPRVPADRHPHCAWKVFIDESLEPTPEPPQMARIAATLAANLPLTTIDAPDDSGPDAPDDSGPDAPDDSRPEGMRDYAGAFNPDLQTRMFTDPVLRAIDAEVCLQGHLLSMSFMAAVEQRYGTEAAVDAGVKQFTGVAGVAAARIKRAFGLGNDIAALATVFHLHPAFRPLSYVDWQVTIDGDTVRLALSECLALAEEGIENWVKLLADGHDRALSAIAYEVDPSWRVRADGIGRWVVERSDEMAEEMAEVILTKFSTGAKFGFER
jgi:hypothetical protein